MMNLLVKKVECDARHRMWLFTPESSIFSYDQITEDANGKNKNIIRKWLSQRLSGIIEKQQEIVCYVLHSEHNIRMNELANSSSLQRAEKALRKVLGESS